MGNGESIIAYGPQAMIIRTIDLEIMSVNHIAAVIIGILLHL
jgi:hypothetical protein